MRVLFFILSMGVLSALMAGDIVENRTLTLDTDGIHKFEIDCGAGFLKITGDDAADQIEVEAEIVMKNIDEQRARELMHNAMVLSLESFGSKARLEAGFDSKRSIFSSIFGRDGSPIINLTITVPKGLEMFIDDGSGDVSVRDTDGDLYIDDGSGGLEIDRVTGDVHIDDGSGKVVVTNIKGRVVLDDGSGSVNIEHIDGNVAVDDGAGRLVIYDVDGDVEIDDGSGTIEIESVQRDVTIKDHGSGSVSIHDVKGKVRRYDD